MERKINLEQKEASVSGIDRHNDEVKSYQGRIWKISVALLHC